MKKAFLATTILLAFIIVFVEFGCSKSGSYGNTTPPATNCNGINPSFSTDVLPLMQTKCGTNSDCHAAGSINSGGPLTNFTQISVHTSHIKSLVSSGAMPKTGSLTTSEKTTIICWINNGAANN